MLSTQVTHLVIKRPQSFHYKPGDYVYLNIPAIAAYEWHPFTISSAPEQQGTAGNPPEQPKQTHTLARGSQITFSMVP